MLLHHLPVLLRGEDVESRSGLAGIGEGGEAFDLLDLPISPLDQEREFILLKEDRRRFEERILDLHEVCDDVVGAAPTLLCYRLLDRSCTPGGELRGKLVLEDVVLLLRDVRRIATLEEIPALQSPDKVGCGARRFR